MSGLFVLIQFSTIAGIAVWLLGRETWNAWRRSIRLPLPETFVLAAAIPVGINAVVSLGQYFVDRVLWFIDRGKTLELPVIASYYALPHGSLPFLAFAAFLEEMVFRGLLQPYLVRRYGALRGIFFVGVVFAAWHFNDDFGIRFSGVDSLVVLETRLRVCLVLSFVLGWLALKTKSILPPAVAHTLYNVFVFSPLGPRFPGLNLVTTVLWFLLACALFRWWPVQDEASGQLRGAPDSEAGADLTA